MLHVYEGTLHHPKTTLPEAPTLLVLHELSALLNPLSSEPTCVPQRSSSPHHALIAMPCSLASYLSLIMHALTAVQSLSAKA